MYFITEVGLHQRIDSCLTGCAKFRTTNRKFHRSLLRNGPSLVLIDADEWCVRTDELAVVTQLVGGLYSHAIGEKVSFANDSSGTGLHWRRCMYMHWASALPCDDAI